VSADPAALVPGTAPSSAPSPAARAPEVREQAPQIARARAIAVTKTAPSHRLQAGDLICGSCGEGNVPARKFCSRCGSSLVEAATVARLPWWRRIHLHLRRGPKVVALGTERGKTSAGKPVGARPFGLRDLLSQTYRKGRVAVAIVIVGAGVLYGVYPAFRTDVNLFFSTEKAKVTGVLDAKYPQVIASHCAASASLSPHEGSAVCENTSNLYWLAPWSQANQPTVTVTFQHPVTLTYIEVDGAPGTSFEADARPAMLTLRFSNGGTFTTGQLPQQQSSEPIRIHHAGLVKSVQVQVSAIYAGQTNASDVAIGQLQFYGLKL
jgi:hypothetical protein